MVGGKQEAGLYTALKTHLWGPGKGTTGAGEYNGDT